MATSDSTYFSPDYEASRVRFLELASRIPDARQRTFHVPCASDKELFVDYLEVPARGAKDTLLVLTSGVHGAEGFAGSAVQTMYLTELDRLRPDSTGLLIVHALNPFGFKYGRRATEANVNLNRNFGSDQAHFDTENPGYAKLADLLEPRTPVGSTASTFVSAAAFVLKALLQKRFTAETLNRSLAFGQFRHPRGLEFGGRTWEPQIADFASTLKAVSAGYRNVVLFDLHTGLGDRYELHLIPIADPASCNADLVAKLFDPPAETHLYRWTDPSQPGFYETAGDLNSLPPHLMTEGQKTLTLTFEFGTLGNGVISKIDTLSRLLAENRGYFLGYRSKEAEQAAKKRFAELFAPSETKWRETVVGKSREVLKRVLSRLGETASDH